jgi:hypothetical protein
MYSRESIKRYVKTFFSCQPCFMHLKDSCFCYPHAMQLSLLDKVWSIQR